MKLVYTGPIDEVAVGVTDARTGGEYSFTARRGEPVDVDAKVEVLVNVKDPDEDRPEPERVVVRLVDSLLEQGVWFEPTSEEGKAAIKAAAGKDTKDTTSPAGEAE